MESVSEKLGLRKNMLIRFLGTEWVTGLQAQQSPLVAMMRNIKRGECTLRYLCEIGSSMRDYK